MRILGAFANQTGRAGEEEDRDLERRAIRAAKGGDWDALDYLYSRHADDVLRFVQSIVRNRHDAEDVTQEVFAKLMRKIHRYEEREVPFAAWITRVARNAALDHVRSRRQIPVEEVRISENGQEETSFERLYAFKRALAALPESQRQVLILRHIGGLSPNEIADRLGKTEASVQGLHHRGRAALKLSLSELGAAPVTAGRD
ncbi:MAG TPA: sigma-70 family RNA polymerase sigma factor [Solirubrobacterales bacterium]|jgi:RNA polymerase sigma-70 factor (ECF subfamily)